jgi:16S rRNA G966 N2-methylase RsmD
MVKKLGFEQIRAIKTNAMKFIAFCSVTYDIIFADPPYEMVNVAEIPNMIFQNNILKQDGLLILEHSSDYSFNEHTRFINNRSYGSVNFSFFK